MDRQGPCISRILRILSLRPPSVFTASWLPGEKDGGKKSLAHRHSWHEPHAGVDGAPPSVICDTGAKHSGDDSFELLLTNQIGEPVHPPAIAPYPFIPEQHALDIAVRYGADVAGEEFQKDGQLGDFCGAELDPVHTEEIADHLPCCIVRRFCNGTGEPAIGYRERDLPGDSERLAILCTFY